MEQETSQAEIQHYRRFPVSPKARFALMQLGRNPDLRQMHQIPVSEEAKQRAGEHTLSLCSEAMLHRGENIVYRAADLLSRGVISDHAFIFVFTLARGPLHVPADHEVYTIYEEHVLETGGTA